MPKQDDSNAGCTPLSGCECTNFKVESILSVDERGQMVLPKEVRERAGIGSGDKLALIAWEKDKTICCMCLIKTDQLAGMVKGVLGPMMSELSGS